MTVPAPRPRRTFPEIAAVSWEHPADRAALQTLRSVPGFEEVTRKILGFLGGADDPGSFDAETSRMFRLRDKGVKPLDKHLDRCVSR